MRGNTRLLFKSLLKRCQVDCVLDIGSLDGSDSLKLREILPDAVVVAFEANPINYGRMVANPNLRAGRIEVLPYAMTNKRGTASFHVTDVDHDKPEANRGTSSLLVHRELKVKQTVEVQTWRIDEFILSRYPDARRIGLWIDVEGAEFEVLEGMAGIRDRVVAAHVETARTPQRLGQRGYAQVETLMSSLEFVPAGTNMTGESTWGDVVFVSRAFRARLGLRYHWCRGLAGLTRWCQVELVDSFLQAHCLPLHRILRRFYAKRVL